MLRECAFAAIAAAIAPLAGCSLLLDFSESKIPKDASNLPYTAEQCELGEPNDTVGTATVLAGTASAAICAGPAGSADDHDFFKFTVPANTGSVAVRVTYTDRPAGDLDL